SFLDSPAHRGNLLSPSVDRVGVGAAVGGREGSRELFVTQLFARFPTVTDTASAGSALHGRVDDLRKQAQLAALIVDGELTKRAAAVCCRVVLAPGRTAARPPAVRLAIGAGSAGGGRPAPRRGWRPRRRARCLTGGRSCP